MCWLMLRLSICLCRTAPLNAPYLFACLFFFFVLFCLFVFCLFLLVLFCFVCLVFVFLPCRKVRYAINGINTFRADAFITPWGWPISCIRFACVRSTPTLAVILQREILHSINTNAIKENVRFLCKLTAMPYRERPQLKKSPKPMKKQTLACECWGIRKNNIETFGFTMNKYWRV